MNDVDPVGTYDGQREVSRSEMKMDDVEAMGEMANTSDAIEDILNEEA